MGGWILISSGRIKFKWLGNRREGIVLGDGELKNWLECWRVYNGGSVNIWRLLKESFAKILCSEGGN